MATIKDIADRLGISVSTVSKGLNGGHDISDELRRKVLDTAVELGYHKKGTEGPHSRFVLFIENMDYESASSFGHPIVLGFEKAAYADDNGVDIVAISEDFQKEHDYDTFMMEHSYAGAYILGFSLEDPWMKSLETTHFPTVLLDNYIAANPYVGSIGTDSEEGIDMAVSHLVAQGHEKIAFLDGSKGSYVSDIRMLSYLRSMYSHHLPINPDLAVYGYFVKEAAAYHVPTFLSLGATAIICGNDDIAEGVYESVKAAGFSVPEDVSVIGFDDLPPAAKLAPPLTTIHQDLPELGKSGYYILKVMTEHIALSKNLLRPKLVVRDSTAIARPRLAMQQYRDKDSVANINPALYNSFLQDTSAVAR